MVRKLVALMALVLTLGMAAAPVAAQDIDASTLKEFGLESGHFRGYMNMSPDADVLLLMVGGFQFDDAKNAEKSFEDFSCGFAGGFGGSTQLECDKLADEGKIT